MAPINNLPFLTYLLTYLSFYNFSKAHLAVGYKHKKIIKHFGNKFKDLTLNYIIEDEPLGTGGAIKKALNAIESENVRSEERRVGKGVDLGGRRIIKKKRKKNIKNTNKKKIKKTMML